MIKKPVQKTPEVTDRMTLKIGKESLDLNSCNLQLTLLLGMADGSSQFFCSSRWLRAGWRIQAEGLFLPILTNFLARMPIFLAAGRPV